MSAVYDALQSPFVYQDMFQPSPRGPVELIAAPPPPPPPRELIAAAPPIGTMAAPTVTTVPTTDPVFSYTSPAYTGADVIPAFVEAMPQLTTAPLPPVLVETMPQVTAAPFPQVLETIPQVTAAPFPQTYSTASPFSPRILDGTVALVTGATETAYLPLAGSSTTLPPPAIQYSAPADIGGSSMTLPPPAIQYSAPIASTSSFEFPPPIQYSAPAASTSSFVTQTIPSVSSTFLPQMLQPPSQFAETLPPLPQLSVETLPPLPQLSVTGQPQMLGGQVAQPQELIASSIAPQVTYLKPSPPISYESPPMAISYTSPQVSPRGIAETVWPSSYPSSYAVGESVEVWSKTKQAWCPGWVKAVQGGVADVDFQLPDGTYGGKIVPMSGGEIRSPTSSPRTSPIRVRTPSPKPGPRRQPSFPVPAPVNQVVRTVSSGSMPGTQVVRSISANPPSSLPFGSSTLPVAQPQELIASSIAPQAVSTIEQQYEQQLRQRDQQIGMKDRLVEDLRQAIDNQRREAEELRRAQTELLFTNQEQARRLEDLERLLHEMQSADHHLHQRQIMHHERKRSDHQDAYVRDRQDSYVRERRRESLRRETVENLDAQEDSYVRERRRVSAAGERASQALALRSPEPAHHQLLGGDRIDLSLQEFFELHQDFEIGITKHKPGWYTFDKPINKKVYIKMVGDSVIVRAGGGHVELHKWLSGFRSRAKAGH